MLLLLPLGALAGQIDLGSTPPGARVYLDGADTGRDTPVLLQDVAPGVHDLRIIAGCLAAEARLVVPDQGSARLQLSLVETGGSMRVFPTPTDATVLLGDAPRPVPAGEQRGVPCGPLAVRVQQQGYREALVPVQVRPFEQLDLPVRLDPLFYSGLSIRVSPDSAQLSLDGAPIGVGDQVLSRVEVGAHVLEASAPGHQPLRQAVVVEKDTPNQVELRLLPQEGDSTSPGRSSRSWSTSVGVGLTGLGVAGLALGGWEALRLREAWQDYESAAQSRQFIDNGASTAWFEEEVRPHRRRALLATGAGAALAAGGVSLVVAF
jgi:PEGA domain